MNVSDFISSYGRIIVDFWRDNAGAYLNSIITIILVIIGVKIAQWAFGRILKSALIPKEGAKHYDEKLVRGKTLEPLVLSVMRYLFYFIGLIIILQELGVDTAAILASAGVLGIAIGFGAQNTVKDFISGFFLIFDGLITVGDVITVDGVTGLVEQIDLRNTHMREFNGRLWCFPNGDVRTFGNFNRGWCRAIAEVGMAYEQATEKAFKALQEVADGYAKDFPDIVVEPPEVQGVMGLDDSSVGLRIIAKVKPMEHWAAERELRRRIKDHFDETDVEIPFPRHVVYSRKEE